ncbi:MAG: hypothetical protein IJ354_10570 [Clostridia bacterium]|nr:hypothetical protein [Clostridia bacterium]
MNLLELSAILKLDTTQFDTGVASAITKGEDLGDSLDRSLSDLDTEIASLDAEIALLQSDIQRLDDEAIDLEIMSLEDDITRLDNERKQIDGIWAGLAAGAVEAVTELVSAGMQALGKFLSDSVDAAAQSGSEIAAMYLDVTQQLEIDTQLAKQRTGEFFLPLVTGFKSMMSMLAGVDDEERLTYVLGQIDNYQFENIAELQENLSKVFGMFEQYAPEESEAGITAEDMKTALESQTSYWTDYADTLQALQSRNISTDFLAEIANGSVESLNTLKALEAADDTQLQELTAAYETLESTRTGVAEGLSELQLSTDESFGLMLDTVAELVNGLDQSSAAKSNAANTGAAVVEGLASQYPAISNWVDTINAKLSTVGTSYNAFNTGLLETFSLATGNVSTVNNGGFGGGVGKGFATGLDYVPHDDYIARLHEGEAVLTKLEATEWRKGGSTNVDAAAIGAAVSAAVSDAMRGFAVYMDGHKVGNLVTETVSRNIAQNAQAGRYA